MFRFVTLFLVVMTAPLAAQDADFFGAAVAFSGNDLLVVKRAPARGPAAVHVFRQDGDGWHKVTELKAPGAIQRGFALSPSIVTVGDDVYVGSGEPNGQWGAHAWKRQGANWVSGYDAAIGSAPPENSALTLSVVMQILQPQPRQVAAGGEMMLIGYKQHLFLFKVGNEGWQPESLELTSEPGLGSAVAIDDTMGFVGSPLSGTGHVLTIAPSGQGVWSTSGKLDPADLPARSRFGTALSLDGSRLAVGAPGVSTVVIYANSEAGWLEQSRITMDTTTGFGSSVVLSGNELLVGGGATVHRFQAKNGEWTHTNTFTSPDNETNDGFGSALAIGEDAIAVGAQFAVGGRGRVWVYPRTSDSGFGMPTELAPDPGPQTMAGAEVECKDGTAAGFECSDVDLESFVSIESLGGDPSERVSDLWGWTDPQTGREYALVGRTGALVFVDISDPSSPRTVGELPANPSGARDIKVFRDFAFMTGDGAGDHGLVVFDLTRLRAASGTGNVFTADAVYHGIASAHNLVIDTSAALAIPVAASSGGETCGGGLHMVDISNPRDPQFAGCYTDSEGLIAPGRTHDAQCVAYRGPDTDYTGREICFSSNETALRIVDVTDRANPKPISRAGFPGQAYIHQGWLTEDQRYFYLNDELDELVGNTDKTRTVILDVADLDDPVVVGSMYGTDASSDHNMYVKGNRLYQANYQSGLRVWDISDPLKPTVVGHFDTTPYQGNASGFYGAWTAFPYFKSGTVIVSSMQEGLFVVKPRPAKLVP